MSNTAVHRRSDLGIEAAAAKVQAAIQVHNDLNLAVKLQAETGFPSDANALETARALSQSYVHVQQMHANFLHEYGHTAPGPQEPAAALQTPPTRTTSIESLYRNIEAPHFSGPNENEGQPLLGHSHQRSQRRGGAIAWLQRHHLWPKPQQQQQPTQFSNPLFSINTNQGSQRDSST